MKAILILVLAMTAATAAHAQLYKWVDKDGKVTYSDQPPPDAKASRVNPPPPVAAPAAPRTAIEKDKELEKGRTQAREKAKADEEAAKRTKAVEENCARARANLRTVTEGGRIAKTDEKGERVILDDEQIAAERVRAEKSVAELCKNPS
jgi:hypothetical protein